MHRALAYESEDEVRALVLPLMGSKASGTSHGLCGPVSLLHLKGQADACGLQGYVLVLRVNDSMTRLGP